MKILFSRIISRIILIIILLLNIWALPLFAQNQCEIIGFWEGTDGINKNSFDFNDKQFLALTEESGECKIISFGKYEMKGDTLIMYIESHNRIVKSFTKFIGCDSIELFAYQGNKKVEVPIKLGRRINHQCDKPTNFLHTPPFYKKPENQESVIKWFLISYFTILLIWLYFVIRKQLKFRFRIWFFLTIFCLFFTFLLENPAIYFLFLVHASMLAYRLIIRYVTSSRAAQVFAYGVFTGGMILIEHIIRFGTEVVNSYFTITPVVLNIMGIGLALGLFRQVYKNDAERTRWNKTVNDWNNRDTLTGGISPSEMQMKTNSGCLVVFVCLIIPQLIIFYFKPQIVNFIQSIFL